MAEARTKASKASVDAFLNAIADPQKRDDCREIATLMQQASGAKPEMWGKIVGFGRRTVTYAGGRTSEWMLVAFAPRKSNITLYLHSGFAGRDALLDRLGKHSCGKGCVYIKRLADIDRPNLKKLIDASVKHARDTSTAS